MDANGLCIPSFWQNANLIENEIPITIQETAEKLNVVAKTVNVDENEVFYREVEPFKGLDFTTTITLLLLHGAAFSSETWEKLNTIQLLSAMGYRTVAIDLPGFGNSPNAKVEKQTFLSKVVKTLNLNNPVVISPSLSGLFSLPYMLRNWPEMGGYVPVAPVGTDLLENIDVSLQGSDERLQRVPEELKNFLQPPLPNLDAFLVPTMVVYGEKDRKRNSALLSLLPCSQAREIPKAKHPAYLDDPPLWHKLLYNFLKQIEIAKAK
ncbi:putative protein-lysine deacylase ABHD14B [Centruroides vittatus]|uniref:putative protein-lysine deacylase ABHD14B n=1 Tax=Centruroides vittatus TaxID=120091 RepID=UPI0035104992